MVGTFAQAGDAVGLDASFGQVRPQRDQSDQAQDAEADNHRRHHHFNKCDPAMCLAVVRVVWHGEEHKPTGPLLPGR